MLFNLFAPLADEFGALNVFRYLTFRTGGAVLTALLVSFIFGPMVIRWLRAKQGNGQPIRDDGPHRHILEKFLVSMAAWAVFPGGFSRV